ncbi:catechol 2,3-dioxygenase-like lactoylglutathione lyase family enzyme [Anaerosolibacter carboniphilus]|uniref:Catechol 2,3-dioxygenase-like lactoylglutathione lyase family enzyme n=1 Tax=Anaerosolibacter carboniphilus TaxID=1417629 RepID=A0A841KXP4_9FIRM|nr:VOC family protein [Anaerosolibacter carboniphilus]MBB6218516.1 catechol 2,3-dioxygenase-like lactoylglutathione lyase family enzyme [Anaerosolibacter carboniphilus]
MRTLEHVGICAKNTVALKDWYMKLFNLKVVYDNKKENPTFFLLMEDESMIEIYHAEEDGMVATNKHQGVRHLAFGTDQIEEEYKNLQQHNVEIIEDLKVNPNGVKTVFFRDIEGNILHFIQRPERLY